MRNTLYDQARKEGKSEGRNEGKNNKRNNNTNSKRKTTPRHIKPNTFLKNVKIIHKIGLIIAKLLSLKFFFK